MSFVAREAAAETVDVIKKKVGRESALMSTFNNIFSVIT